MYSIIIQMVEVETSCSGKRRVGVKFVESFSSDIIPQYTKYLKELQTYSKECNIELSYNSIVNPVAINLGGSFDGVYFKSVDGKKGIAMKLFVENAH